MTRNVRDLRELVCVSRLSVRDFETDDSYPDSGEDDIDHAVSIYGLDNISDEDLAKAFESNLNISPSHSTEDDCAAKETSDVVVGRPGSAVGAIRRPVTKRKQGSHPETCPSCSRDFQKQNVNEEQEKEGKSLILKSNDSRRNVTNLDLLLDYVDAAVVADMLVKCTKTLNSISTWMSDVNNYVTFCRLYLNELPLYQRDGLINLEFSIVKDELKVVFKVGLRDGMVLESDLDDLLATAVHEYPCNLTGTKSSAFFLKMLYVLSSGTTVSTKTFLSNVKYSTKNKNHIQWILGIRAFALINIADGVIQFYCKIKMHWFKDVSSGLCQYSHDSNTFIHSVAVASIQQGYCDVLKFLIKHMEVDIESVRDKYGRNAVIIAITNQQNEVLEYLIKQTPCFGQVNEASESGNSPLHMAVAFENLSIVQLLLDAGANPNYENIISGSGMPLHSAVLNGNMNIIKLLVSRGACVDKKIDETNNDSATALAKATGKTDIVDYLQRYSKQEHRQ